MDKIKRTEAVLEAKYCDERENAPLAGGIIFAYGDVSHSFMSKDIRYMVSFRLGGKKRDFRVDKEVYDRLEEGSRGTLEYRGKEFMGFR